MSRISSTWRWYEEDPERLEWELAQLEARGWSFSIDEHAFRQGRVLLEGNVEVEGRNRRLAIVFPNTYPEHRLEIYDLTGDGILPLHQQPYHHNLCLLDNLPEAWTPSDSAAFMVERFLELRRAARNGVEGLKEIGVDAPEPQSTYYPYTEGSSVLVPESLLRIAGERGRFFLRAETTSTPVRGLVSEVRSQWPSRTEMQAPPEISRLFSGPVLRGPWFRVPGPPPWLRTAQEFRGWAASNIQGFDKALKAEPGVSRDFPDTVVEAFALVYPDQGPEGEHDAWLICLLIKQLQGKHWVSTSGALLRPFVLGSRDQERRIAPLIPMRGKKVAILGLGTVGAPIALELGRTGLLEKMLLVDYDHYSIGNLVRHPLTLRALGRSKVDAVAAQIHLSSPFTKVIPMDLRLGDAPRVRLDGLPTEGHLLGHLEGVDLIVDATADGGTSRFLNRFSLGAGIPLIVASVTEGGWGGEVVRSLPGKTGCYECYLWEVREGAAPVPNQDHEARPIFTRGCGFPTFTGAGFDALSLAADAARLAAQTLVAGAEGGYPEAPYDVLIRHNRGSESGNAWPRYDTHRLRVHPSCEWHKR